MKFRPAAARAVAIEIGRRSLEGERVKIHPRARRTSPSRAGPDSTAKFRYSRGTSLAGFGRAVGRAPRAKFHSLRPVLPIVVPRENSILPRENQAGVRRTN